MSHIRNFVRAYREIVPLIIRICIELVLGLFILVFGAAGIMTMEKQLWVEKSTHDRVAIETPYEFDDNCIYDPNNQFSYSYDSGAISFNNALCDFHDKTGIQVYVDYFYIDEATVGQGFQSEEDIKAYCSKQIEERYGAKLDYSVVIWRTNGIKVYPENADDKSKYKFLYFDEYQYVFGSKTQEFLDGEGREVFSQRWEKATRDSDRDKIKKNIDSISKELLTGYSRRVRNRNIAIVVIAVIAVVGVGDRIYRYQKKKASEEEKQKRNMEATVDSLKEQMLAEAEAKYTETNN